MVEANGSSQLEKQIGCGCSKRARCSPGMLWNILSMGLPGSTLHTATGTASFGSRKTALEPHQGNSQPRRSSSHKKEVLDLILVTETHLFIISFTYMSQKQSK